MNSKLWKNAEVIDLLREIKLSSNRPTTNNFFITGDIVIIMSLFAHMFLATGINATREERSDQHPRVQYIQLRSYYKQILVVCG